MQTRLYELQIELMENDLTELEQIIDWTDNTEDLKYLNNKKKLLIKEINDLYVKKHNDRSIKVHRDSDCYKYN
jgi:hypothetical protein